MIEIFTHSEAWVALLTLTFLEIVLGLDNLVFISIAAGKLPKVIQKRATNLGLVLALVLRIILLLGISYLIALNTPIMSIKTSWFVSDITGQSIILLAGGIFLLFKSTREIHHKVEGADVEKTDSKKNYTVSKAVVQIALINLVFSFDSILTAVGMTNGVKGSLEIMIISVLLSMVIMMLFATPVGKFVNDHPTVQMLALSFLILIGFMLVVEAAHLSHTVIFKQTIGAIPKGYLYFAIAFSLGVEALNMKMRKFHKQ
jgi:predicted tellurium resistance membrane protein TerC